MVSSSSISNNPFLEDPDDIFKPLGLSHYYNTGIDPNCGGGDDE